MRYIHDIKLSVASAWEWGFTAQMLRWYCACAHLRENNAYM